MGRAYGTLYVLTFLLCAVCLPRVSAQDTGTHVNIRKFVLPQYREKDGTLQFIVQGETADNKGAFVHLTGTMIDILSDNVRDMSNVKLLEGSVKPYPLLSRKSAVREFWQDKDYTRGIVFSDQSVLDKTEKVLRSDGRVFFRSPEIDADGVGFTAYHERKLIKINSDVRVVIHPEARRTRDLRKKSSVAPVDGRTDSTTKQSTIESGK